MTVVLVLFILKLSLRGFVSCLSSLLSYCYDRWSCLDCDHIVGKKRLVILLMVFMCVYAVPQSDTKLFTIELHL